MGRTSTTNQAWWMSRSIYWSKCILSITSIGVPSSPLQTAVGATKTSFPIWQSPMTIAIG